MTVTFGVNEQNDIFINSSGNLDIQTGIEATAQACAQISKAQLGEIIYAAQEGIPNFQTIWNGVSNIVQWEAALRAALLSIEGVQNILNLTTSLQNNVLSYTAEILTIYGTTIVTNTGFGAGNGVLLGESGEPLLLENGGNILLE